MIKILTPLMTLFCFAYAGPYAVSTNITVVPHDKDYYTYEKNNVEIIYTESNLPFARQTAAIETPLRKDYEKFFYWRLDETLYIGLLSDCNQIANGFSTQWPNNRQMNYVGGTQQIDYFSSSSWLNTLLYHETAHNYQVNVKGSKVSRALHSVLGNGLFYVAFPYVIVPNIMENSFMLEGNAVLNESWHGNGGRLYSGRFKAQTILQAALGQINPAYVYNDRLAFPYGDIHYIQGGFYNLYMAQKYGIQRLNSYFRFHSEAFYWPEFTNDSMHNAVGIDFERSVEEFAKEYAGMAKHMSFAKGTAIANSQFFYSLGNDTNEIFFITNESGVSKPELVVLNKSSLEVTKKSGGWLGGKVVKSDEKYYTQGSKNVSPTRVYQGLFNSEALIKDETKSKMVQGYLSDGKKVYFDVASSFDQAQLYVGDELYAQVNSSVIIDSNNNIYYFVQKGKTRTLYKNKTPLYSYQGFYGMVSDVDSQGVIYFVANSEYGSTLYRYKDKEVSRAHKADNIVEARLVNDSEVLIACVSEKDYYYVKNELTSINQAPFETKLFFEDKPYYGEYAELKSAQNDYAHMDLSNSYYSLLDMHYSGAELYLTATQTGTATAVNLNFADPLTQNSATLFANKDVYDRSIVGINYSNYQYLLQYSITGYKASENKERTYLRDSGVVIGAILPFYKRGYYSASLAASYYQDYELADRAPYSATLNFSRSESYGFSMSQNYLNSLTMYGSNDRDDKIVGAEYNFKHDLPYEFYFGVNSKYSKLLYDENKIPKRGVKIANLFYASDQDPTTINIPSMEYSGYAKTAGYGEVNLQKVLNISSYWFTFPFSLKRESIYTKYRYYDIKSLADKKHNFNEATAGITFETVALNKFSIPITFEYIYNDADFIQDSRQLKLNFGTSF